jgi:adenylate cyclase
MIGLRRPSFETLLTLIFVAIGIAWGGFLGARQMAGTGSGLDRLENLTLDWRFLLAGEQPAPRGVVLAAIDDDTVREAGGYPLPRNVLARIVRALAALEPQAIALDMLFLDPGKPEADSELTEALRATKAVVAALATFEPSPAEPDARVQSGEFTGVPQPSNILWPIATVRDAARAGLVNLATDYSGVPRHVPMIFRAGEAVVRSFALAASAAALNTEPMLGPGTLKLASRTVSMDLGYHLPIRYYGPRGSIRQFSAAQALRGNLQANDVRGQIVLIGATVVAAGDTFATPFDRGVPGVEIFATAVSNVVAGDGLIRTRAIRTIDASTAVLLPTITVLLMAMRRTTLGLALAGVVLTAWVAAAFAAFRAGYWLSIAVPLAAAAPVAAAYGVVHLAFQRRVARRLAGERATLAKFQSPLLDHILQNPQFLEQPVHQEVAVVFLDLSGYTTVAEALGPQWTRDLLASFQALVERDVATHRGYVITFMGDGAMILFGLPQPAPDDPARALAAIMALHASIATWLRTLPPAARNGLSARIGGHVGPAVVSRLGSAQHQHVTATGDTVNVTSRLLEVAKQQGASLVVSEELWSAASAGGTAAVTAAPAREVAIRGRTQSLRIRVLD